jgi:hypothetical protein
VDPGLLLVYLHVSEHSCRPWSVKQRRQDELMWLYHGEMTFGVRHSSSAFTTAEWTIYRRCSISSSFWAIPWLCVECRRAWTFPLMSASKPAAVFRPTGRSKGNEVDCRIHRVGRILIVFCAGNCCWACSKSNHTIARIFKRHHWVDYRHESFPIQKFWLWGLISVFCGVTDTLLRSQSSDGDSYASRNSPWSQMIVL